MNSQRNLKPQHELRLVEFRAVENEEGRMIIEGQAITYDQPATHEYGKYKFTETIRKGALDFADMKDVPLRYNHNDTFILMARTRNKSLQLILDDTGLKISAELIDTQSNRDIYKSIQEGLIDKMSFAFTVSDRGDTWAYGENETFREVTAINRLYDVSVVDTPFYDTTSVYARSVELLESNLIQLESFELRKRKFIMELEFN